MDRAASAGFEGIAQMLLEQKKVMDALEVENRDLRRQLADLRRGIGVSVVIGDKTLPLAQEEGVSAMPLERQGSSKVADSVSVVKQLTPDRGTSNNGSKDTRGSTALADSFVV